jgi:hypothetical protein
MRIPRSTGAFSASVLVLLGLWGALIPFVGPYFDYAFGVNSSWHLTTDRLWLCIVPGAVTAVAGLLLLVARHRAAGVLGGWLAVLAGAWFVIGPALSGTWEHGAGPIGRPLFGTTRQALELIGCFYGLGALIVALGAFAIGRFVSRPAAAPESMPPAWAVFRDPAEEAPDSDGSPPAQGLPSGGTRGLVAPASAAPSGSAAADATRQRRRSGGLPGPTWFARNAARRVWFLGH